jgi:O-antigen ligase
MSRNIEFSENKLVRSLKKMVIGFLSLALLVPFIFSIKLYYPFNSPRSLYFMLMVQAAFFCWLILISHEKKYRPRLNALVSSVILFIGFLIVNTFLSHDPVLSFWSNHERMGGLLMFIHLFAFFLVLCSTLRKEKEWHFILGVSVVVASLVSVIGMADNSNLIHLREAFSQGSTLANTSFMGTYLLMSFFLALYLFLSEDKRRKNFYAVNLFLIFLGVLLNPGGRAMKGALFLGLVVFVLLYLAFVHRNKLVKNTVRVFLVLGVILSLFVGLMVFQEGFIRDKVFEFQGMSGRLTVWEGAWQGFLEKPLIGWGMESFGTVFLRHFNPRIFLPEYGAEVWFDRAHNIVFDSLVTTGIIGTVLFFGIFFLALYFLYRRYLKEDKLDFVLPIVFTSFLVAHFIQGLTVFDMVSSYAVMFLFLAFVSFLCFDQEEQSQSEKFKPFSLVFLIGFLLTANLFVYQPYQGNQSAIKATLSTDKEDVMFYHRKAVDSSLLGRDQIVRYLAERAINTHKSDLEKINEEIEKAEGLKEQAELRKKLEERKETIDAKFLFIQEVLEKNIQRKPHFRDTWGMSRLLSAYFEFKYLDLLVESYSQNQETGFSEALELVSRQKESAEKSIELSPGNLQAYWELAQAEINFGKIYLLMRENEKSKEKFQEAMSLIEKSIEMEPRLLNSHIKAINVAETLLGNFTLANEKRQEALKINPFWIEALEI